MRSVLGRCFAASTRTFTAYPEAAGGMVLLSRTVLRRGLAEATRRIQFSKDTNSTSTNCEVTSQTYAWWASVTGRRDAANV
jgi:hypothetical protein